MQVTLEAEVTNKGALALYGRLGFVRAKRLFRYYLNGVDAFRLKLLFPRPDTSMLMASRNGSHVHPSHHSQECSQSYHDFLVQGTNNIEWLVQWTSSRFFPTKVQEWCGEHACWNLFPSKYQVCFTRILAWCKILHYKWLNVVYSFHIWGHGQTVVFADRNQKKKIDFCFWVEI